MSARDVTIDTLDFESLVKIALDDLPGASAREWTLRGAVDPGITILELLAAQLEQRLFMADQLTEPIVRASMRLLGLEDPRPATAAATVLSIRAAGATNPLPAGTLFGLQGDTGGRAFATDASTWVQPVTTVDVQGSLRQDGDVFELALTTDPAAGPAAGGTLALLVEVAAAPGVAPAWEPGAADVDPPATLRFEAVGPAGTVASVAVDDTTGALRRSGLLTLDWPLVWNETGPQRPVLRIVATQASYTEAVRILGVAANAVVARHRVPGTADVTAALASFLPLPGQIITLDGTAGQLLDAPGDVVLSVTERSGERHTWTGVRSWVGIGPADRVFLVDRDRGELRFGDGRSGRILRPAAAPDGQVAFTLGGGRDGNLGPGGAWGEQDGAALAVNPVPAEGGAEAESIDLARLRSAGALSSPDRTVTAEDAETLAVTTPGLGLARAHVTPGLHPGFPCVPTPGALSVTIVPYADRTADPDGWTDAPQPDAGALASAATRLEGGRLLGQELFVLAPVYRRVAVRVRVSASAQAGDARGRIVDALRRHLDPLEGGTEGVGWPFGGAVRPSALAGVVQHALGPEAAVSGLQVALDGGVWSDCSDAEIGSRELVWLEHAQVDWVTALPTGGGLR